MASNPLNMSRFTLATLFIEDERVAAIGVDDSYYLVPDSLPSLKHTTEGQNVSGGSKINLDNAQLLTPIISPNKLVAVGANYTGHLKEMGLTAEKWASMPFFIRPPTTSLVGPGKTEEAAEGIAGYSIGLDLSCRDLIPAGNELQVDLMRGIAQDTMAPCGPFIVPAKFLPDTSDLRIRLFVNDKPMMDSSTSEMMYKCDEQLSIISSYMTLEPGDVVFTGSPSGSAHVQDRILAEIEGIGRLDVTMIPDD
ncbi:fumarylacetoacetate hydrolase [Trichoderma compactum]